MLLHCITSVGAPDVKASIMSVCRDCNVHMQPSKIDRYMQRKGRGKLQGAAVHNSRQHFKPTPDSYDHNNNSFHMRRLLLKAEPQSGKTGVAKL